MNYHRFKCPHDSMTPLFTKADKEPLEARIKNRERQIADHQAKIDTLKAEIVGYQKIISKIR